MLNSGRITFTNIIIVVEGSSSPKGIGLFISDRTRNRKIDNLADCFQDRHTIGRQTNKQTHRGKYKDRYVGIQVGRNTADKKNIVYR